MEAASGQDRIVRGWIGLRWFAVAMAGLLAFAPAATRSDDVSPTPVPAQPLESLGNGAPSSARASGPVVTAAPRRETAPGTPEPPAGAAGTIASDTDGSSGNAPQPPRAMPVVKPIGEDPLRLPADAARVDPAPLESSAAAPAPARLKSVVNSASQPLALQKFGDLPPLPPLTVAPVVFKGITPGTTTAGDLQSAWGEPLATKESSSRRIFKIAPYRQVQVTLVDQKVAAIAIELEKPFEPGPLSKQLHLEAAVPVTVTDEAGQPIGQSFPERGVLFSYAPQTTLVTQILLEPIDAEPFLLRAEATAHGQIRGALRDLDFALGLDPRSARARALAAQLLVGVGRLDDALKAINQAIEFEPKQPSHTCLKIEILKLLDDHAEAIAMAKELLGEENLLPVVKAQTQNELGDLLADGPDHDYKTAVDLHLAAARTAGALSGDHHAAIRRAAKQTLIEAHLGAACDVALGAWQQKEQTSARWISRADELAKDFVQSDGGDPLIRLHVARRALDARVGILGRWDASDWTARAIQDGQKLIEAADDPLRRECIEWELSLAVFDIGELDQFHGFSDHSLADRQLALKLMTEGGRHRQQTAADAYRLGRLYAQIGMTHAVQERNHTAAIAWFARALPLLDRPMPPAAGASVGLVGESFVSMGITYWETGHREEGLRLTIKGTDLMAKAVAAKLLDERALAIPYGNLSTMHRELGHTDEARGFSETAARYDAPQQR